MYTYLHTYFQDPSYILLPYFPPNFGMSVEFHQALNKVTGEAIACSGRVSGRALQFGRREVHERWRIVQ